MTPMWHHFIFIFFIYGSLVGGVFPCINLPDQEKYNQYSETEPSIRFHIYHIIGRCTAHGTITLKDKKMLHA